MNSVYKNKKCKSTTTKLSVTDIESTLWVEAQLKDLYTTQKKSPVHLSQQLEDIRWCYIDEFGENEIFWYCSIVAPDDHIIGGHEYSYLYMQNAKR